jgi:cytochrome c
MPWTRAKPDPQVRVRAFVDPIPPRRSVMMRKPVASLLLGAALAAPGAAALGQEQTIADKGQLLFNNACRTCHTLKQGDNRLGPHLNRIIGRKMGALPDYGYSSAMKSGDLVWDRSTLDRFIADPDRVVPGNTMKPFGGVASAEDRASIITYLEEN